jgi:hypothetical protein
MYVCILWITSIDLNMIAMVFVHRTLEKVPNTVNTYTAI